MSGVNRYISTRILLGAGNWGSSVAPHTYVHAADYDRLAQECERLRLDNLSKNGSIKAMGEQIAKLQRAVKNRDRMIAKAGGTEK